MTYIGTREAAELWNVPQWKVTKWCSEIKNKTVTQEKKGSPYRIPKDYPNPFNNKDKKRW